MSRGPQNQPPTRRALQIAATLFRVRTTSGVFALYIICPCDHASCVVVGVFACGRGRFACERSPVPSWVFCLSSWEFCRGAWFCVMGVLPVVACMCTCGVGNAGSPERARRAQHEKTRGGDRLGQAGLGSEGVVSARPGCPAQVRPRGQRRGLDRRDATTDGAASGRLSRRPPSGHNLHSGRVASVARGTPRARRTARSPHRAPRTARSSRGARRTARSSHHALVAPRARIGEGRGCRGVLLGLALAPLQHLEGGIWAAEVVVEFPFLVLGAAARTCTCLMCFCVCVHVHMRVCLCMNVCVWICLCTTM